MEYTLLNGTPIGKSVVVGSVRHGPSNYAALAANGDILEVAATPSYGSWRSIRLGSWFSRFWQMAKMD